jgi:hypothetical protein
MTIKYIEGKENEGYDNVFIHSVITQIYIQFCRTGWNENREIKEIIECRDYDETKGSESQETHKYNKTRQIDSSKCNGEGMN